MASDAPIYIFLGPSLPLDQARAELDALYLPPVSQGDVYRVGRRDPWAIGIIDGYFDSVPAVWHKEILWALSRGIHVFGSASMGALRAAELSAFGMTGVGEIFRQYQNGTLEDDDEVAIIHGPAELGYPALSDAMVNIRQTVAAAVATGVITEGTGRGLVDIAKACFYRDRSFDSLLQTAARKMPDDELAALARWLPDGRVDQKRADATLMLRTIREHRERDRAPGRVSFVFEHSPYSVRAAHEAGEHHLSHDGTARAIPLTALMDELRQEPGRLEQAFDGALYRSLLLGEARRLGLTADNAAIRAALDQWRSARGLTTADDLTAWKAAQGVSEADFDELLREEALLAHVRRTLVRDARSALPRHLKATGEFGTFARRILDKSQS